MMKLSVVIPTFNKLPRLKLMLESMKNQTLDNNQYEVIIVDDGSVDGTSEYIQEWMKQSLVITRYIYSKHQGRSASRNRGLEIAKGSYILFTDDDLILSPNFLENHLRVLENNEDKKVGVRGFIYNLPYLKFLRDPSDPNSLLFSKSTKKNSFSNFDDVVISKEDVSQRFLEKIYRKGKVTHFEKGVRYVLGSSTPLTPWIACNGGNFSISKNEIINAGGFDEGFGYNWGCEDIELGYRLYKQGVKFISCPEASNFHLAHFRENYAEEHQLSLRYFFNKHKDPLILELSDFFSDKEDIQSFEKRMSRLYQDNLNH